MLKKIRLPVYCLALSLLSITTTAYGASDGAAIEFAAEKTQSNSQAVLNAVNKVSSEIQNLKREVITLNKDLRVMEEELLFPSSTQYSVFVSQDIGKYFVLEGIKLKIDGKLVTSHIYSPKQRQALAKGGVQKLYTTNLNEGKHNVTAFFIGIGPNGRAYKRASSLDFDKGKTSQYIELAVADNESSQEPVFNIKTW